jgi:hypothetical protein
MTENTSATTLLSRMISTETVLGMVLRVMAEHPKLFFTDPELPLSIQGDENSKRKPAEASAGMLMAAGLALSIRIHPCKSSRVARGPNPCGRDRFAKGVQ